MAQRRRKFERKSETDRQTALIEAALDLIAETGPQSATVRAIAERAGVTSGLIRHYFVTKEDLLAAAYAHFMARMTADHRAAASGRLDDPLARLALFVRNALSPPLMEGHTVALWAGFLHMVQQDPAMGRIHSEGYLAFRAELETLIVAAQSARGRTVTGAALRADAIACNALIDGLWLEGGVQPEMFAPGELARIGVERIGAMLDLPLTEALARPRAKEAS